MPTNDPRPCPRPRPTRSALGPVVLALAMTALPAHAQDDAPFRQHRADVSGRSGAVVAGHPLAAAAGYEVLRRGGNATDAAVTMAGVLAVVRPHMNGVGGDAFALFFDGDTNEVGGLNGSGRAGALATPAFFAEHGIDEMPGSGALTVTVPGAVSAWAAALERHGTITLAEALAPAIELAENGWVVTSTLHRDIGGGGVARLNDAGRAIFAPDGDLPPVGAVLRNPRLAATLRAIAQGGADAFYRGGIGATLARFIEAEGGYLRAEDFRAHEPNWVEPLAVTLDSGHRVHAIPPNSQGFVALQQLAMLESFDLAGMQHNSAEYLHTLIEVKKLAFADRDRWNADPEFAAPPLDRLLDREYLRTRAALVSERAADSVASGIGEVVRTEQAAGDGDTVYLMAVDADGNAVSWIQSLFSTFGSKLVEPETGIVLQNRGAGFTLDEDHPNVIAPGKRPFHTLMPLLVTDTSGALRMTLGTPGGHAQSQALTQVFHNVFTFGMTPQQAIEAPRYVHNDALRVLLESIVPESVVTVLERRGHEVRTIDGWSATFGGVQIILVDPVSGTLRTGADPRREGYGLAY